MDKVQVWTLLLSHQVQQRLQRKENLNPQSGHSPFKLQAVIQGDCSLQESLLKLENIHEGRIKVHRGGVSCCFTGIEGWGTGQRNSICCTI